MDTPKEVCSSSHHRHSSSEVVTTLMMYVGIPIFSSVPSRRVKCFSDVQRNDTAEPCNTSPRSSAFYDFLSCVNYYRTYSDFPKPYWFSTNSPVFNFRQATKFRNLPATLHIYMHRYRGDETTMDWELLSLDSNMNFCFFHRSGKNPVPCMTFRTDAFHLWICFKSQLFFLWPWKLTVFPPIGQRTAVKLSQFRAIWNFFAGYPIPQQKVNYILDFNDFFRSYSLVYRRTSNTTHM